jgi:cell division protein FtsB
MKLLSYFPSWLRNKFLLATVVFLVWMLFFDRNDVFTQWERRKELQNLQQSKLYYTEQISQESKFANELKNNPAAIEKYAREKYKMKRDDEDLFLIQSFPEK